MLELIVAQNAAQGSRMVADMLEETLTNNPRALLGLATGGTVVDLYALLCQDYAAGRVDFGQARTVNVDEYVGLPASHDQSFAWFMRQHLFAKTNIAQENVYLFNGAEDPQQEIARMADFLGAHTIDILLLGVGTNGHIGFNEPDRTFIGPPHIVELAEETIQANMRFFQRREDVPRRALTLGIGDVVKAKKVILMAFGPQKAEAIARLFGDDLIDPQLPCSVLKLVPEAYVVVDQALAAAAGLAQ